jgi:HEAT repeat protein
MNNIRLQTEKVLNIHSQDWAPLLTLLATFVLMYLGLVSGSIVSKSLFIKKFGVEYLPYMYICNAVLLFSISMFIYRFIDQVDQFRLFELSLFVFLCLVVLSRILLVYEFVWLYPLFFILEFITYTILNLEFWLVANNLISTRQAKRLFPLIATGELFGVIAGSFGIAYFVRIIGTPNLFIVWAICILGTLAMFQLVRRRAGSGKPGTVKPLSQRQSVVRAYQEYAAIVSKLFTTRAFGQNMKHTIQDALENLRTSSLLKLLFVISIIYTVLTQILDYNYLYFLNRTFTSVDQISSFIGIFDGICFSTSVLFQLFFTNRILQRFGINNSMLCLPFLYVGGYLVLGLTFSFRTVVGVYFGRKLLSSTIHKSSYQTIYNLVPQEKRGRLKTIIECIAMPCALLCSSFILLAFRRWGAGGGQEEALRILAYACVGLAVVYLFFSLKLKKIYMDMLISNLRGEDFDSHASTLDVIGRMPPQTTQKVLLEALNEKEPAVAIFATEMLMDVGTVKNLPALFRTFDRLVKHTDDHAVEVASAVLRCAGKLGGREAVPQFLAYLPEIISPRVLTTLIGLLGEIGEPQPGQVTAALAGISLHPREEVRAAIASALWKLHDPAGLEMLKGLLISKNPNERVEGSAILHQIDCEGLYKIMLDTINDFVSNVRENTIKAIGEHRFREASSMLISKLGDIDLNVRKSTQRALIKIGDEVVDDLIRALEQEHVSKEMKVTILEIIREISSRKWEQKFVELLLHEKDETVQYEIIKSLDVKAEVGSLEVINDFITRQLRAGYQNLFYARELRRLPQLEHREMLLEALTEANTRLVDIVLRLKALVERNHLYNLVNRKKDSAVGWERDNAIEILENLSDKDFFTQIVPFLEDNTERLPDIFAALELTAYTDPGDLFEELLAGPNDIMRACACFTAGGYDFNRFKFRIKNLSQHDPAPLVRESAQHAFDRLSLTIEEKSQEEIMLTTLEKIMFLKRVPLFAKLSVDELKIISTITKEKPFEPNDTIIREFEQSNNMEMYIIVSGRVVITKEGEGGKERVLTTLGAHEFFGEMSIFDNEPRSATIRAVEQVLTLSITQRDFRDMVVQYPRITFEIFRVFSMRLREADELVAHAGS